MMISMNCFHDDYSMYIIYLSFMVVQLCEFDNTKVYYLSLNLQVGPSVSKTMKE